MKKEILFLIFLLSLTIGLNGCFGGDSKSTAQSYHAEGIRIGKRDQFTYGHVPTGNPQAYFEANHGVPTTTKEEENYNNFKDGYFSVFYSNDPKSNN